MSIEHALDVHHYCWGCGELFPCYEPELGCIHKGCTAKDQGE